MEGTASENPQTVEECKAALLALRSDNRRDGSERSGNEPADTDNKRSGGQSPTCLEESFFITEGVGDEVLHEMPPFDITRDQASRLFQRNANGRLAADWQTQLLAAVPKLSPEIRARITRASKNAKPAATVAEFNDTCLIIRISTPAGNELWHHFYRNVATLRVERSAILDNVFDLPLLINTYALSYKGIKQGDTESHMIEVLGRPDTIRTTQATEFHFALYEKGTVEIAVWKGRVFQVRRNVPVTTWNEMLALLKKPISDGEVKQFVARFGLGQTQKFDSGSFANEEKSPIALLYSKNKVDRIVVRLSHAPGQNWPIYTGTLPLGLQRGDMPKDAIRRLGQPLRQAGPDYLVFRNKKCDLVLTFDPKTHGLSEIALDAPVGKFNRTEPSAYDKLDAKAILASIDRLVRELNASLPPGWHAASHWGTNAADKPDIDEVEVRITFETPIWKEHQLPPNSPSGFQPKRVKEPPCLTFYLLPKWRQDEATHVFDNCPFFLGNERSSLVSVPENISRQYDAALTGAEKLLTKRPEPASDGGETDIGIELSVERVDKKPFTLGEVAKARFHIRTSRTEFS